MATKKGGMKEPTKAQKKKYRVHARESLLAQRADSFLIAQMVGSGLPTSKKGAAVLVKRAYSLAEACADEAERRKDKFTKGKMK